MNKHKVYIDEEGVKRGYYVYLHKATESGEVFYVGKGSGNRAWETNKRNDAWRKKVAELGEEWEVEIYKYDLSEIEAFNLEEQLVEEYGFFEDDNSRLTNRTPGGEQPASCTISFGSDGTDKWQEAYYNARKFNDIKDKDEIAKSVEVGLSEIYQRLHEIDYKTDFSVDEEISDHSAYMLIGALKIQCLEQRSF